MFCLDLGISYRSEGAVALSTTFATSAHLSNIAFAVSKAKETKERLSSPEVSRDENPMLLQYLCCRCGSLGQVAALRQVGHGYYD